MENSNIWTEIQDYMKSNITPTAYYLWISAIELAYLDDTSAKLKVPKELNLNVIKANYSTLFDNAFENVFGHKIAVELTCNDTENNIISESEKFTFDNFVVGASNRFAYAAAKRVADEVDSKSPEILPFSCNPLLIYGEKRAGKTHLLNAIRNEIKVRKPNLQIAFVDGNSSIDEVSTNADVLLVDDVQLYMNDEFFNIYNSFINSNKQVVLTADKIYSQFDCGLMADIAPADFETKSKIENKRNTK